MYLTVKEGAEHFRVTQANVYIAVEDDHAKRARSEP